MFQDEAGLGRINKPKHCWCRKGMRPRVPCHHLREYRYAYGAVDPVFSDGHFLVLPNCDTVCINIFLESLSAAFPDDYIPFIDDKKRGSRRAVPQCESGNHSDCPLPQAESRSQPDLSKAPARSWQEQISANPANRHIFWSQIQSPRRPVKSRYIG